MVDNRSSHAVHETDNKGGVITYVLDTYTKQN